MFQIKIEVQTLHGRSVQFPLWLELGLAHLWALSAILSLVGIALSPPFSLSERPKVTSFKITMVRLWENFLGNSRQNLKTIQRLTNLGS